MALGPFTFMNTENTKIDPKIEKMMKAGAHLGYTKTRRHPSVASFILGTKNKTDIIDLEKTLKMLEAAKEFIKKLATEKKQIVFIGTKPEAKQILKLVAEKIDMPYVAERWIGGTISNFSEIRKRIERMLDLKEKKVKGELDKYTKKERLMFDREVKKLEIYFIGLTNLKKVPDALFIVDAKKEDIAVKEALQLKIPVIALCNIDSDIKNISHPIIANDGSMSSIKFFMEEIADAYGSVPTV